MTKMKIVLQNVLVELRSPQRNTTLPTILSIIFHQPWKELGLTWIDTKNLTYLTIRETNNVEAEIKTPPTTIKGSLINHTGINSKNLILEEVFETEGLDFPNAK